MIKVHFLKTHTIPGFFIRLFTFSEYNHVAIEVGGSVFEARAIHGVRGMSPAFFFREYGHQVKKTVENVPGDEWLAYEFLDAQIDKPYDFKAIFAFPFRRDWQDRGKWFCSELVAAALIYSGWPKIKQTANRVTPRDLWLLL